MRKKYSIYNNGEIDLSELFKMLWDGKIKIILIAIISFVIIISYDNHLTKRNNEQRITTFNNKLFINPTKENEFLSFISIYNIINKKESGENFIIRELKNTKVLDRFIEELLDYDELITVLKENENIKKKFLNYLNMNRKKSYINMQNYLILKSQTQKMLIMF